MHAARSLSAVLRIQVAAGGPTLFLVVLGLIWPISASHAQRNIATGATARSLSTCTYDSCALRVEEGIVVQGVEGLRIADVRAFEWSSDSAAINAERYQRNRSTAGVFRILGFTGSLASLGLIAKASVDALEVARASEDERVDQGAAMSEYERKYMIAIGISLGSSAVGLVGRLFDSRARKALSRAVWWHNRAFARP